MSYQLKVKSQEAGPWGVGQSRYVKFHIPGNNNWEIANSYIEFQGQVDMSSVVTYANGYTGRLTWGFRDATDEYNYASGPAVLVRHAWLESEKLGKVESKRYANRINEHLKFYQRSENESLSQSYSGGTYVQVVNNEFTVRLQLSDLLELAKDMPLVDLEYMGDCVLTLELEVVNAAAQFLKYENQPTSAVLGDNQPGAAAGITVIESAGITREESELHLNQVYQINWDGSVTGAGQTSQHTITNLTTASGVLQITISPALGNALEDVTGISIEEIVLTPPDTGVDSLTINVCDLVMYKPYGMVKMDKLQFREMLVDTDNQPDVLDFHKQWVIEPNVESVIFMNPNDDQFVNLHQLWQTYRNQINGYDTIDRDVHRNSGLYWDRLIMSIPNVKHLSETFRYAGVANNRYHISERMPMNGQLNNLNLNIYYGATPGARTAYLFKHQIKEL